MCASRRQAERGGGGEWKRWSGAGGVGWGGARGKGGVEGGTGWNGRGKEERLKEGQGGMGGARKRILKEGQGGIGGRGEGRAGGVTRTVGSRLLATVARESAEGEREGEGERLSLIHI